MLGLEIVVDFVIVVIIVIISWLCLGFLLSGFCLYGRIDVVLVLRLSVNLAQRRILRSFFH